MAMKWISILLLLLLVQMNCYFRFGTSGKVVVWPMEYSHWLNLKVILEELTQRGHEVTVLRPSSSIFLDDSKPSSIQFETFPTSSNKEDVESAFMEFVTIWMNTMSGDSCLSYSSLKKYFMNYSDLMQTQCEDAVTNKQLMKKLQESKFDVLLADGVSLCGELIAELLNIPFLYSVRFTPGYKTEKLSGGLLFPPSYVPVIMSGLGGEMTFMERVKNMICVLYFDFWFQQINEKKWDQFYTEILGRPTTLYETMKKAEMWLIRSYWDLEYPRPALPNVDFVGGLQCKPAKPLPKEMEEFVQSSGEHGIVVFSLGSMMSTLSEERANIIASALARIPQKVIWRFQGKKPDTLGDNTRLYKWIPQNDLLGHPKTKAFVTHGGANGVYEAIYHGIPMIGFPLFGEQHDNIANMVSKGAAVALDIKTISKSEFLNALKAVIDEPSYKKNAMWLSTIHHDQPMKPLDRAVFWIEFVMRHKGAKHLRPLAHKLSWYQYYSLDVIGFLLACMGAISFLTIKCLLCVCRSFMKMRKKQKKE